MVLPHDYLEPAGFMRPLLRRCMETSRPEECADEGASAVKGALVVGRRSHGSAPSVGTPAVGAPELRFPQGANDFGVAFSAASALAYLGDAASAGLLASLAPRSLA